MHSSTPYIHPRLDSRTEPKFSDCQGLFLWRLVRFNSVVKEMMFKGNC